jgi:hypothetical protein
MSHTRCRVRAAVALLSDSVRSGLKVLSLSARRGTGTGVWPRGTAHTGRPNFQRKYSFSTPRVFLSMADLDISTVENSGGSGEAEMGADEVAAVINGLPGM